MTCECRICKRARRIDLIKEFANREQLLALVDELHERLCSAEADENWATAIIDGSWPEADEIIKRARA